MSTGRMGMLALSVDSGPTWFFNGKKHSRASIKLGGYAMNTSGYALSFSLHQFYQWIIDRNRDEGV